MTGRQVLLLSTCLLLFPPGTGAARADIIASNFEPAGVFTGGSDLGNSMTDDPAQRFWKAFGLAVGPADLSFTSLEIFLINESLTTALTLSGGIYADLGGNPGGELVAFTPQLIAAGGPPHLITLTAEGPFTLAAGATYWFALTGPVVDLGGSFELSWVRYTSNNFPVTAAGATAVGYRFSPNNQGSWTDSTVFNLVQINGDPLPTAVPEPSGLALLGLAGGLVLAGCRRRLRRPGRRQEGE